MHAMSRTVEDMRDKFADTGILVRYKRGYVAWHLTLPHRDPSALDALLDAISTRRFCGSRTPPRRGTRRPLSPLPATENPRARPPPPTQAAANRIAPRSDSGLL